MGATARGTKAVGTFGFVSPEVLNNLEVTTASDMFALGRIIELLSRAS
jgi:serine/threonine protein kinase